MQVTGIILSGGKSSRFRGQGDKALLPLTEEPIIQWIIDKLSPLFKEILVVTNKLEDYKFLLTRGSGKKVKLVSDIYPGKAALSGLHSGLFHSKSLYNFVIACDLPFIRTEIVQYLLTQSKRYDVVIPWLKTGQEPFCAVYSKNCLKPITGLIKKNAKPKIINFFSRIRLRKIAENEIKKIDPDLISFFNLNTPRDYQKAQKLAKKFLAA